jgi:hypothetical protein
MTSHADEVRSWGVKRTCGGVRGKQLDQIVRQVPRRCSITWSVFFGGAFLTQSSTTLRRRSQVRDVRCNALVGSGPIERICDPPGRDGITCEPRS